MLKNHGESRTFFNSSEQTGESSSIPLNRVQKVELFSTPLEQMSGET